jgi:hypothetical protein
MRQIPQAKMELGHKHSWVDPLGMSSFQFTRPIELLKNCRKHLNETFHYIFCVIISTTLYRILIFNGIKDFFYFDVSNHCI